VKQVSARVGHAFAAEADAFDAEAALAKGANQVGTVHVAARLAGADEDSHGVRAPWTDRNVRPTSSRPLRRTDILVRPRMPRKGGLKMERPAAVAVGLEDLRICWVSAGRCPAAGWCTNPAIGSARQPFDSPERGALRAPRSRWETAGDYRVCTDPWLA